MLPELLRHMKSTASGKLRRVNPYLQHRNLSLPTHFPKTKDQDVGLVG